MDDPAIARRVQTFLRKEFDAGAEDFSITVRRGRVILHGDAPTLDDILRLGAELGRIDGVVHVANLLRLRARSQSVLRGDPSQAGAWLS